MTAPAITADRAACEELPAAGDPPMRVVIADHDGLARRMMQSALQDAGGVLVITARDRREALELARYHRPTVLLVDIALPPAAGAELIREVLAVAPKVRILTVSAAADDDQAAWRRCARAPSGISTRTSILTSSRVSSPWPLTARRSSPDG